MDGALAQLVLCPPVGARRRWGCAAGTRIKHRRRPPVWSSACGPLRPFVLNAGASQGQRVAEGGGQPAASVSPDAILTAGVSSFTCGSRLPAALGPVPAERADTRACASDAAKVAERQDGLACSAQVKEEAAAEGRRRGTRSRSTPARPDAPASNCQSGHRLPRRAEATRKRTPANGRNGPQAAKHGATAFHALRAVRHALE